ncbi:MAG: dihydrofolate reductase family protein [Candidatus Paceibacterota bacterium]|jgi:dihydrofolate reductase
MKTFIIAAVTADGFIAEESSQISTDWTSAADKAFFRDMTKKAGVMIMGSKTYETIGKPLPGRKTVVMSRTKKYEGVETTSDSPEAILARLEKEGFKEVAICGGASIYALFAERGLVDAIYLTVEPLFIGQGIPLFSKPIHMKAELVTSSQLAGGAVVLEYKVIRP